MSAPNPLAVPPDSQADTHADTQAAVTDSPARARQGKASCGFCGQAWFGTVAYCPYCGHPSTGAPADQGAAALLTAERAHLGGSARTELPEGADALRCALAAAGPSPQQHKTGRVASASAAAMDAMQVVAKSVRFHAGRLRPSRAPAGPRADEPGSGRVSGWKPVVAVVVTLAVITVKVDRLTDRGRHPVPEAAPAPAAIPAAVNPPPGPTRDESASSAQAPPTGPLAPRADRDSQPQPQASAAPAPPRPLCSAANAAAGLCNPQ